MNECDSDGDAMDGERKGWWLLVWKECNVIVIKWMVDNEKGDNSKKECNMIMLQWIIGSKKGR